LKILHNEELHNLQSLSSVINIILSRRVRMGHLACIGGRGRRRGSCWEGQKKRYDLENLRADRRIILMWILEEENGVVWAGLI
jgi:hypothetical protein